MEELTMEELELEILIIEAKIEIVCQTACMRIFDSIKSSDESLNANWMH